MINLNATKAIAFVTVNDRARGVAFYRDKLGLSLQSSDDFGDFFDLGGSLMRLTAIASHVPVPHTAFGWQVTDISAAVDDLAARGMRFEIYDGMGQDDRGIWTAPGAGAKVAWFKDDDGNLLSLSQS